MATHYAIMRGQKYNSSTMNGIIKHVTRTQKTPNADPAKRHLNYSVLGPRCDDNKAFRAAINERTPKKYRQNAVRIIEFMITASPDWFKKNEGREREFFEEATAWFQREFGAENVVAAVVHKDESSPHMHLMVVPRDESTGKPKLNAKALFGNRGVMHRRQSNFADAMAHFGIERGKADPERRHTKVAEWRAGHAKLDERESVLACREAHVARLQKDLDRQHASHLCSMDEWHKAVSERESQAHRRETSLSSREEAITQRERELESLSRRLQTLQSEVEDREQKAADMERRLDALKRELNKRGERLSGGEDSLVQRQREIDRAGEKLNKKLSEARRGQKNWEERKNAWIRDNRPRRVPDLVRHLQRLESLGSLERAEYLDACDSDDLYDHFSALDGLTSKGRDLMAQYQTDIEAQQRWDRDIEPGRSHDPGY